MLNLEPWLVQTSERDCRVIVDASDLTSLNNKNAIHVLHVDDDPTIIEVSKLILMDMDNFEIDHACCVDEALKKLATRRYDVVISDYEMPQKNGLHFLTELRKQNNNIPFILFTGKGREEVAIKALNLGADGYYNKQGNPETVYGELAHGIKMSVEHWKSKQQLIDRELKYQNIFNNSEVGMFRTKLDGSEILDFNEKYQSIFGLTREEMRGKHSTSFWADPLKRQEMVRLLQANGYVKDFECKMLHKYHGIRNCLTSLKLYPEQGIIEGTIIDISEHKKAEQALIQSEETSRNLINGLDESVWVIDFAGNFLDVNNAAVEMLAYSKEELQSLGIKGIDNYLSQEQVKNLMSRVASGETQVFETVHTTKDGTKIPVEISSSLISYQRKQAILAI